MSQATIRAAIKTIMMAVSDKIRNVIDYDIYMESPEGGEFVETFCDEDGNINHWEISVSPSSTVPYASKVAEHFYDVVITGRRSRVESNESVKLFSDLAATVAQALSRNRSLNNTSEPTSVNQVGGVYFQQFGNEPLCAHIDISFQASELEQPVTWS